MSDTRKPVIVTVSLEAPIARGDGAITTLQLRKPSAGELRGLTMVDLTQLKTDAVIELLPRISMPPITDVEASGLDAADLFMLSVEIAGFFMPAGMRPDALAKPETAH